MLPLPQRAATRAPLSSTRDDDSTAKTKSAAADRERADPLLQEDEGNGQLGKEIVMSPSDYNVDDNGFAKDVVSGQSAPVEMDIVPAEGDKKLPPRRRSTYEDFVELFGSQGAA